MAAELLDRIALNRRFHSAVEIGCSEGAFTEVLAGRTDSLLAVDFSPVALERARQRCAWARNVSFQHYDLRRDPPPGRFELVVVMDVLTSFRRPGALRAACARIVGCVDPGGYLLITDHRQLPVYETAWWARPLMRGGKRIVSALAGCAGLTQLDSRFTDTHVLALFGREDRHPELKPAG